MNCRSYGVPCLLPEQLTCGLFHSVSALNVELALSSLTLTVVQ